MKDVKHYIDLSYKSLRASLDLEPFLYTVEKEIEKSCEAGLFSVNVGTINIPIVVIRQVCIILMEKGFIVQDNTGYDTTHPEFSSGGRISIQWNPLTDKVKYY